MPPLTATQGSAPAYRPAGSIVNDGPILLAGKQIAASTPRPGWKEPDNPGLRLAASGAVSQAGRGPEAWRLMAPVLTVDSGMVGRDDDRTAGPLLCASGGPMRVSWPFADDQDPGTLSPANQPFRSWRACAGEGH